MAHRTDIPHTPGTLESCWGCKPQQPSADGSPRDSGGVTTFLRSCIGCSRNFTVASQQKDTYCPACGGGYQLELPGDVVEAFRLPHRPKVAILPDWSSITIRDDYKPGDGRVPKYRPVHWHDWLKEETKPWRLIPALRDEGRPMKTKPGPNTYTVETIEGD